MIIKQQKRAIKQIVIAVLMATVVGCFDQGIQSGWSTEEIQEIATIVQKDEIIFYGIEGCSYCRSAKGWLTENNFIYTDCDIEKSERCHNEYTKAGGNGIPFLVINRNGQTQQMHDGFDSDQMLNILADPNLLITPSDE